MGLSTVMDRRFVACLLIVMCFLAHVSELEARFIPSRSKMPLQLLDHLRGKKFQVELPTILTYHNGSILSGTSSIPVYVIWYGNFSDSQRSTILDFFTSTQVSDSPTPSVASWWKMTCKYRDANGLGVPPALIVQDQINDNTCSKGKSLVTADLESLVTSSLSSFPTDSTAMYLVLTADDVTVEQFCTSQCASHFATSASSTSTGEQLPYGWVGNPGALCPGKCSWPFAQPDYGPYTVPLLPPNGDVGVDGLIINMASILAGMATNPFNTGFYQGDAAAPLEAATACAGIFGEGAYAGYAGQLLSDNSTGESFNAWGVTSRKFLLPALWEPTTTDCVPPS